MATPADDGATLQCRVTATNAYASVQALSKEVVADPQPGTTPPDLTTAGTVTGTPNVGNNLTCNTGTWTGSPTFADPVAAKRRPDRRRDRQPLHPGRRRPRHRGPVPGHRDQRRRQRRQRPTPRRPTAPATSTRTRPRRAPRRTALNFDFSGVSAHGEYVYYTQGNGDFFPGALYSFNTATGATTEITSVTDAQPSNISPDGSHVYFVSNTQIGGHGAAGQPNLYVWSRAGGTIDFIATLGAADVTDLCRRRDGRSVRTWSPGTRDLDETNQDRGQRRRRR